MKTIIVTTDFSPSATNAAKYAASFANALGIEQFVLYHSYDLSTIADLVETDSGDEQTLAGSLVALKALEAKLFPLLGDTITTKLVANEKSFVEGVQALISELQADMVVVGATGTSRLERLLTGSNTIEIANACAIPVLVVPKKSTYTPIANIVFACDLREISKCTPVPLIQSVLDRLNTKFTVLNVGLEGKRTSPDVIREQHKLHELLDTLTPAPDYHYIDSSDVVDGITNFAEEHKAGLIISVPKTHGFFEGLFHRSVSKRLIGETELPILLLRETA